MSYRAGERVLSATVITVSDRCVDGRREDRSGPIAIAALHDAGWHVTARLIGDGADGVEHALRAAVTEGADVVVTTGGTGIAPRDLTPEGTARVLDRRMPGIEQLLMTRGLDSTPHAVMSRGLAGVTDAVPGASHRAFIVNLPGSTGGVRDGMDVLMPLLAHIVEQLEGWDHLQ